MSLRLSTGSCRSFLQKAFVADGGGSETAPTRCLACSEPIFALMWSTPSAPPTLAFTVRLKTAAILRPGVRFSLAEFSPSLDASARSCCESWP